MAVPTAEPGLPCPFTVIGVVRSGRNRAGAERPYRRI